MKYRIVKRSQRQTSFYFAQKKYLNLFWVDLPLHSVASNSKYMGGAESSSPILKLVENYIEMCLDGYFDLKQTVIKTYE